MSRIGKLPIALPAGVKIGVHDNVLEVQGPKGKLEHRLPEEVGVEQKDGSLAVVRKSDDRRARALHGLTQRMVANMVHGVHDGFSKTLEIVGVGYRAEARGNALHLSIGYSHPILFQLPPSVQAKVEKMTVIKLDSIDRQVLGEVASMIRRLRPPEPYKGKGIRFAGEVLRRKSGKAAGAAGG